MVQNQQRISRMQSATQSVGDSSITESDEESQNNEATYAKNAQ